MGFWLDRALLWNKHINEISSKTSKLLNLLKILTGPTWGVHPKHLRSLYISLIRSRLDYGSFIYDNSANTHLSKLDKIQNQALRIIGGFIKSTPIHVMESELSIPPLNIRRLYLSHKYCLKSMSWTDSYTVQQLETLGTLTQNPYSQYKKIPLLITVYNACKLFDIHSSNPLEMFSLDVWTSYIKIEEIIKLQLDSIKIAKRYLEPVSLKWEVTREIQNKYNNWHIFFTDGSKNDNSNGAAYYDATNRTSAMFKLNSKVNIMTLELFAISEALCEVAKIDSERIAILSDSKSALQHIARCASNFRGTPTAYAILKQIHELQNRGKTLRLQWVSSHIGLWGNEQADKLAKLASSDGIINNIKLFYLEYLNQIKQICYDKFKEYFDERSKEKGIWYKTIQNQLARVPWSCNSNLSRTFIVMAHRLRSGHYPTRKFGHLMKKVESPNCDLCGTLDDVQHLWIVKKFEIGESPYY